MNVAIQAPHLPELPRVYVDTTYSTPVGSTINAGDNAAFAAALASSSPGDIIVLTAGVTYNSTFTLPFKSGSTPIYIVGSSLGSLPAPGVRVSLSDAAAMPKILSPGSNASSVNTQAGAHHYRFVGIEFTCPSGDSQTGLIRFGTGSENQAVIDASGWCHHLILDRCIVHGHATSGGIRGVLLAGNYLAVVDSYVYDWKKTDNQCQAIAGWTGEGPWSIKNSYLEADAENFMSGGSDPLISGLVTSDIEFINNLCSKPLTWNPNHASYAGVLYNVANLFELKSARRVLIVENTFEHCWPYVQAGRAIVFTTKNQFGTATWSVVEDVTFINNVVDGVHSGFSLSGDDGGASEIPPRPSMGGQRIRIHNNFIHDVGGNAWGENGNAAVPGAVPSVVFNMSGGMRYTTIQHNTIIQTPASPNVDGLLIQPDGDPYEDFRFLDNICGHNTYGIKGPGLGVGNATLAVFFPACIFEKNILVGGNSANYPANNYFPATKADVGFENPASDYRLDKATTTLSDLTTGLTAFHDLSDVNDSIGSNHLTAVGSPVFSSEGVDLEADLSQSLILNDTADMSAGDISFTFNIWVRGETLGNVAPHFGTPFIAGKGWQSDSNANQEWCILQEGGGNPIAFYVASGTSINHVVLSPISQAVWCMITVWHDSVNNLIGGSINGVPATPVAHTTGVNNGTRPFFLGTRDPGSPQFCLDGMLRRASWYKNRVLTAQNITDLYNAGTALSLAQMQAGEVSVCPYVDVATDEGPLGAPDSVIEEL